MEVTAAEQLGLGRPAGGRPLGLRMNALANIGGKSLGIFVSLFTSPFIIHHIGLSAFGFWAVVSSFSQYAALLDFGVGPALMRNTAESNALGAYDDLARKAVSAVVISIGFAILIVLVTAIAIIAVPESWGSGWPRGWEIAICGLGLNLAFASLSSTFQGLTGGFERWDLQNLPLVTLQVVFASLIVVTLSAGLGLGGLGIATAVASFAMLIASIFTSRLVWRQKWSMTLANRKDARSIVGYGANLQIANLVLVINVQSDKPVLLAYGASLKFIAYYELASRVAFQLRSLPVMALGPLTARAAADTAGNAVQAYPTLYARYVTIMLRYGMAPLFAVYGAAYPLVLAWLGVGYTDTARILVILGAGYALNVVTGAGSSLARGAGRAELDRNYALLGLVVNIVLTVTFGAIFGVWGVIAATAIGLPVGSIWFLHLIDRWIGTHTFRRSGPLRQGTPIAVFGLAVGGSAVALMQVLPTPNRWVCLLYGAAVSVVFFVPWVLSDAKMQPFVARKLRRAM